jgi:hypothetical protein
MWGRTCGSRGVIGYGATSLRESIDASLIPRPATPAGCPLHRLAFLDPSLDAGDLPGQTARKDQVPAPELQPDLQGA